jgi:hypothetical protein
MHWAVDVQLKAAVLQLSVAPALVLMRVVDRTVTYGKYACFWKQRPQVCCLQSQGAALKMYQIRQS